MFLFVALLGACNDAGYALVSISPIYGWVDGCNPVTLSGHGFSEDVSASIGSSDITGLTQPEAKQDKGFVLHGVAPAGPHGYAEVSLRSAGVTSKLEGTAGYYYVECPGTGMIDSVTPSTELGDGVTVILNGCGLDSTGAAARIVSADGTPQGADLPLTSMCGKGTASFTAPPLADGDYFLELVSLADGSVLIGAPCPPGDSGDTGSHCTDYPLTYGGGA